MKRFKEEAVYLRQYPERYYKPFESLAKATKEITRWISKKAGRRDRVLEIGAGGCAFINNFPATEKHALDLWEGVYRYASRDVAVHLRSCTDLSCFVDNYFDLVMAEHLLEHLTIEDALRTIGEVRRILKVGGLFVIVQPNFKYDYRRFYDDWTHRTPFTERGMLRLLSLNGLEARIVMPRFMPGGGKKSKLNWLPSLVYRMYLALPVRPLAKQMLIIAEKKDGAEFYHR